MQLSKIIYWAATILLCAILCYSVGMYFLNTELIQGFFNRFGYPEYLVIPLAVAKICGVTMILWRKNSWLTEWAYAGIFFDIVLAFFAHYFAGDSTTFTLLAIIFLLISYFFGKTVRPLHG